LLVSIPEALKAHSPQRHAQLRALFLLMRWSGLSIQDALTLPRTALRLDKSKGLNRVGTSRQKTGTHVSLPLPPEVARELLALDGGNPDYFLWSGTASPESLVKRWAKFVAPTFKKAGLHGEARMTSHRLRDTFAVDLLQKGVPMEEVSRLLGHTSIKTTEKHSAKWSKGRQDRLDSLVVGTWSQEAQK